MLELCTEKSPFISPNGNLYLQIEGVAMGSPLGPTFANYYMGHFKKIILDDHNIKPYTYARYVHDIYLEIGNENKLH